MAYKNTGFIIIIFFYALTIWSCAQMYTADGRLISKKKYLRQQQEYEPYKQIHTIEGYNEFISKYPKNLFIKHAEDEIKRLEFEPYEKEDTIEGYLEFKILYPENPNVETANNRIEQTEIKRYDKVDTIEGYREFLMKYPDSIFSILPKKRLQELEFQRACKNLEKNYNFDLLLYRLKAKRIKRKLKTEGKNDLSDFVMFASLLERDKKKYFNTYIIFPKQSSISNISANKTAEEPLGQIISQLTNHLDKKFGAKHKIDGFSFDISSSPHIFYGDRKVLFEILFSLKDTANFAQKKINSKEFFAKSEILLPEKEKKLLQTDLLKRVKLKRKFLYKFQRTVLR